MGLIPGLVNLTITNCLSNVTLNQGPVWWCYMPSTWRNKVKLSEVLLKGFFLTISRLDYQHFFHRDLQLLNKKASENSLVGWMVLYAAFNSVSFISRRQLTLFMSFLGFTSARLGSEVSCPRTLPQKNQEDPVHSNPGPMRYVSNTLPLSHAGPLKTVWEKEKVQVITSSSAFPTMLSILPKSNFWFLNQINVVTVNTFNFGQV